MKRFLFCCACALALSSCGGSGSKNEPVSERDLDGAFTGISAAMNSTDANAGQFPLMVMVTDGGWGRYERDAYGDQDFASLIAPFRRVRIEKGSAELEPYHLKPGPSFLVLAETGELITRMSGRRDATALKKAVERAIEFPVPASQLAAEPAGPKHIRYVEVLIEGDSFAGAAAEAAVYLEADPSEDAAHALYLHTYAIAELEDHVTAKRQAERYLKSYPDGTDRAAVNWILLVLDLQSERGKDARRRLDALVEEAPQSPYTRQAVLAYAMEYLSRQKGDLAAADKLLTEYIGAGNSWENEFLLARSMVRRANPETHWLGIDDLETVAKSNAPAGVRAQEMLVQMSIMPGSEILLSREIIFFQKLARLPEAGGTARLNLARLYMADEDSQRAREEASTVAAGGGMDAEQAKLLLASMALELDYNPQLAAEQFGKLIEETQDDSIRWAAKFGQSRAFFFTGQRAISEKALTEMLGFLKERQVLPEAFYLIVPYGTPPGAAAGQLDEYRAKLAALANEDSADDAFPKFLSAFLAASRGDSLALSALDAFVADYPASSLADDALMEKVKLSLKIGDGQSAVDNLEKIVKSYKGSDQFRMASQLLGSIKQGRR